MKKKRFYQGGLGIKDNIFVGSMLFVFCGFFPC
jgi:hypothetical protein